MSVVRITTQEAGKLILENISNPDFIVIDLREVKHFAQNHIPGAINLDYNSDDFDDQIQTLNPQKTYLLYCSGNARANITSELLGDLGMKKIFVLQGGFSAWKKFINLNHNWQKKYNTCIK